MALVYTPRGCINYSFKNLGFGKVLEHNRAVLRKNTEARILKTKNQK